MSTILATALPSRKREASFTEKEAIPSFTITVSTSVLERIQNQMASVWSASGNAEASVACSALLAGMYSLTTAADEDEARLKALSLQVYDTIKNMNEWNTLKRQALPEAAMHLVLTNALIHRVKDSDVRFGVSEKWRQLISEEVCGGTTNLPDREGIALLEAALREVCGGNIVELSMQRAADYAEPYSSRFLLSVLETTLHWRWMQANMHDFDSRITVLEYSRMLSYAAQQVSQDTWRMCSNGMLNCVHKHFAKHNLSIQRILYLFGNNLCLRDFDSFISFMHKTVSYGVSILTESTLANMFRLYQLCPLQYHEHVTNRLRRLNLLLSAALGDVYIAKTIPELITKPSFNAMQVFRWVVRILEIPPGYIFFGKRDAQVLKVRAHADKFQMLAELTEEEIDKLLEHAIDNLRDRSSASEASAIDGIVMDSLLLYTRLMTPQMLRRQNGVLIKLCFIDAGASADSKMISWCATKLLPLLEYSRDIAPHLSVFGIIPVLMQTLSREAARAYDFHFLRTALKASEKLFTFQDLFYRFPCILLELPADEIRFVCLFVYFAHRVASEEVNIADATKTAREALSKVNPSILGVPESHSQICGFVAATPGFERMLAMYLQNAICMDKIVRESHMWVHECMLFRMSLKLHMYYTEEVFSTIREEVFGGSRSKVLRALRTILFDAPEDLQGAKSVWQGLLGVSSFCEFREAIISW